MSFISVIPEEQATAATSQMYNRVRDSFGYLPNMVKAFSHRPEVMAGWNELLNSIKRNMDERRYELVTVAAALELRSSYCMLVHGSVLAERYYDAQQLREILETSEASVLSAADEAIMEFARAVVRDASAITEEDVAGLRKHGLSDPEIFDIASAAAVRCFFSKTLDALGTLPDKAYNDLDPTLREALVVGRGIET
ncbi:peroxidase-related enzyme [Limibacillus sp. MBR-115]|jgi:uncharacterized peroxidase-related enzyme|uniref:carboxymuconolactone decarboxylase family protein n=1 Tax=Limibacillus sp. MBR-115 TaxID=3156465 RepID=UPI0033931CD4